MALEILKWNKELGIWEIPVLGVDKLDAGYVELKTVNGNSLSGAGDITIGGSDATKLAILNNLSDLNNAGTARTNLGVSTTANQTDSSNKRFVTDANLVVIGNTSGTNTGDQTSIVGITGTKAQFDTAVSDGNIMYVGDAPTAHTHTASEVTDFSTAADARISAASINALSDVFIAAPAIGQVLKYNGTNWINDTDETGGVSTLSYSPGSITILTETGLLQIKTLKLTTTQRLTIQGTGRLNIN